MRLIAGIVVLSILSLSSGDDVTIQTTSKDNYTSSPSQPTISGFPTTRLTSSTPATSSSQRTTINVGLITPGRLVLTNIMGYSFVASASTMAVQLAKSKGYLKNIDIK